MLIRSNRTPSRAAALKGGASVLALALVVLPHVASAQQADSVPAQSTPTPNAAQRTAPSDLNAAAQSQAGIAEAPASANAQVPTGGTVTEAQSATATPQDEAAAQDIVVTGIRRSLQSAQAIKKNSEVVVDSISAEDIGALPDRSVTEALQRVPGVSISRFSAGVDPDHFSTEGSGVVVRGLTYTRSELNGRDTFSANNGRGLSFADVPAELLGGVDVFKSPSADMIEGGIAGTVNLRTRTPFDSSGLVVGGTLEMNYGDFVHKSAPTVSVLVSNRWNTSIGEFGLLGSFVRSQVRSRADSVQISNYGPRVLTAAGALLQPLTNGVPNVGTTVYVPRGAAIRSQEFDRVRYGYSAAGQWRSNDESLTATFQFLRSDSRESWNEHSIEVATDNVTSAGDAQPYPGTSFTFDDDNVFTSGLITAPVGYSADTRGPANGLQSNNIVRGNNSRFITDDYGANFKWKVSDRLGINVDYQHVNSSVRVTDLTVWASTYQNADIRLNGSDVATLNFVPLGNPGARTYFQPGNASYLDPYNSYYRSAMDHIEDSEGNEDSARIDLDYSFPEESWLNSIRVGYRFADRENEARSTTYNWGVLSEIWGGGSDANGAALAGASGGPVWFDRPIDGNPVGRTAGSRGPQEGFFFENFFRGQVASPANEGRLYFPTALVGNYAAASAAALQIGDEWRSRLGADGCQQNWVPVAQRCGVVAGTPFLPGEINPINERNHAIYGVIRFGNDLSNGWNVSGNVGLRYTDTRRIASGNYSFPRASYTCPATTNPNGTPILDANGAPRVATPFCALGTTVVANANAFANGAVTPIQAQLNYHYYLPSFNLKLGLGSGVQFRAAFNKSVAAPEFGLTRAFYNVGLNTLDQTIATNGAPVAIFSVGNPYLKPITAENYDLTAEWYFSSVGQLTLSLFKKDLHGVLTNGTASQSFTNNGATFNALVTTPANSTETGRVKGLEIGYQQTYGFLPGFLSGLGLSANFTYVDSSGVAQSTLNPTEANAAAGNVSTVDTSLLPLQGLSKYQFNISPFYQRNGLEIRGAYSWRSNYLLTVRDVIVPNAPVYQESAGQLDASIFYAVTPAIRMGFQGVNLLNTVVRTSYVINDDLVRRPRNWFINDTRYTFSIRASFK